MSRMASIKNEYIWKGIIKTERYDYRVTTTTIHRIENGEQVIYSRYFNIGSYQTEEKEKKTCVDIYVMYEPLSRELPNINYKIAKLITTHHDERCSVDEKLQRGEGTQHMIHTALSFVYRMCNFIEGFEINDASTRLCNNSTTITLSYFSITNYGKTWYERNFNAFIPIEYVKSSQYGERKNTTTKNRNDKKNGIDKMKKYKDAVNNLMMQKLSDWELFTILFLRKTSNEIRSVLKELYDKSSTYGEFFKQIHSKGVGEACIYLQPWIDQLMLSTDLANYVLHTRWVIPINSINRIKITGFTREFKGKKSIEDQ